MFVLKEVVVDLKVMNGIVWCDRYVFAHFRIHFRAGKRYLRTLVVWYTTTTANRQTSKSILIYIERIVTICVANTLTKQFGTTT